jgi:putative sigma-54 modulation protein
MKIAIRTRHLLLTPETHDEIRHRIELSLGRVGPWILAVDVTITDINGPKGGPDKLCRLRVRGRGTPRVVIEHLGTDVLATASFAANRAANVILRKIARGRSFAPLLAS